MAVWAIADLHLSFGVPNKSMEVFGEKWKDHPEKIRKHWMQTINQNDLILIPGDISWAMQPKDAKPDLEWIDSLPGTKVLLRGNHDYWWSSLKKAEEILPPSIHLIQNNVFSWKDISIGGARLWDTTEYSFHNFIHYINNPHVNNLTIENDPKEAEKIFERELGRLENSLKLFPKTAQIRIAMTHYPPIDADLNHSRVSTLLKKYEVSLCVFGHLHNVKEHSLPFGTKDGVKYVLTSCDYLDFNPIKLLASN